MRNWVYLSLGSNTGDGQTCTRRSSELSQIGGGGGHFIFLRNRAIGIYSSTLVPGTASYRWRRQGLRRKSYRMLWRLNNKWVGIAERSPQHRDPRSVWRPNRGREGLAHSAPADLYWSRWRRSPRTAPGTKKTSWELLERAAARQLVRRLPRDPKNLGSDDAAGGLAGHRER